MARAPFNKPRFQFRLGFSQPLDHPNYRRMSTMAEAVRADSHGQLLIDVNGAGALGSDNDMLAMVQSGALELYLGGNVFGPLVPTTEMPGLPFIFRNSTEVFAALDGEMGQFINVQMREKGLHAFRHWFEHGFHHLTTRSRPIGTADDLKGMSIRTPVQRMTVDFFEALGAEPKQFTLSRLYEVLRDHMADGQADPLSIVAILRLYEVQTYLSLTHHWWSGFTLVAHAGAWDALPADLQAILAKHAQAAALAQRQDMERLNASALETLKTKGMIVNEADVSGFKKPLAQFYARWKREYGAKAWALLETRVGKLV
jgi:tripartite ATP-independent transporter DctP family solute receptor